MNAAPQRYCAGSWDPTVGPTLAAKADGPYVLFADVEEALRDTARLAWLMPIVSGDDNAVADRRANALYIEVARGLTGNALVDAAMTRCPE